MGGQKHLIEKENKHFLAGLGDRRLIFYPAWISSKNIDWDIQMFFKQI